MQKTILIVSMSITLLGIFVSTQGFSVPQSITEENYTWGVQVGESFTFYLDYCRRNGSLINASYMVYANFSLSNYTEFLETQIRIKEGENFTYTITSLDQWKLYGTVAVGDNISPIHDYSNLEPFHTHAGNVTSWANRAEELRKINNSEVERNVEFNGTHFTDEIIYLEPQHYIYYKETINIFWGITVFLELEEIPVESMMEIQGFNHLRWISTTPLLTPDPISSSSTTIVMKTSFIPPPILIFLSLTLFRKIYEYSGDKS